MRARRAAKMSRRKKTIIAISYTAGVLIIICFCSFLTLNGKLDKIQYDPGSRAPVSEISSEAEDHTEPDSPKAEVEALNKQVVQNAAVSSVPLQYNNDVYNVLLIGSDTRVPGGRGRSDSMIIISINRKTCEITATSLLRDIYLQIPGISQGNRLNAAYAFGGPALLLKTIQQNFKINVDKYLAVDFFSFVRIVDKVGGVDIDITSAELPFENSAISDINFWSGVSEEEGRLKFPGLQTLNGKQTLSYSRIRYVGNGDFDRTDRQRRVLSQIFSKLKKQSIAGLNELLDDFLPEVTTNLTKEELTSLALTVPQLEGYATNSWLIPMEGTYSYLTVRGMSVLGIDFPKNNAELQKRIYGQ